MLSRFLCVAALVAVFVLMGCEESKHMMPVILTGEEPTGVVDPEPELPEPFEEVYEPEEPSTEPPALEPQIITVRNMITHTGEIPQSQGINWVYGVERLRTVEIVDRNIEPDLDDVDDGFTVKNYINGMILPPTQPDFEGYRYLPFKDGNGNFTVVIGDQIEVVQHEIDERYFRILRNITRPEVDYSIFW